MRLEWKLDRLVPYYESTHPYDSKTWRASYDGNGGTHADGTNTVAGYTTILKPRELTPDEESR